MPDRSLRSVRATPGRPAPRLDRALALPPAAGYRRTGRGVPQRPPRLRQLYVARRPESVLAGAVLQSADLRPGHESHRPGRVLRRPDSARLAPGRAEFHRAQPHSHHGNGVGRRLRPRPPADPRHAGPSATARKPSPLGADQQCDRHRRPGARRASSPASPRRSCGNASRPSRRCIAKTSCTAISSRPTSWSSAPATPRSSTSARRCT